jgi:hypothetical protein
MLSSMYAGEKEPLSRLPERGQEVSEGEQEVCRVVQPPQGGFF